MKLRQRLSAHKLHRDVGMAKRRADLENLADVRMLERKRQLRDRVRLLRSFDPAAGPHTDVPDPYYGTQADFAQTRVLIESAVPGILDWVRVRLGETVVS